MVQKYIYSAINANPAFPFFSGFREKKTSKTITPREIYEYCLRPEEPPQKKLKSGKPNPNIPCFLSNKYPPEPPTDGYRKKKPALKNAPLSGWMVLDFDFEESVLSIKEKEECFEALKQLDFIQVCWYSHSYEERRIKALISYVLPRKTQNGIKILYSVYKAVQAKIKGITGLSDQQISGLCDIDESFYKNDVQICYLVSNRPAWYNEKMIPLNDFDLIPEPERRAEARAAGQKFTEKNEGINPETANDLFNRAYEYATQKTGGYRDGYRYEFMKEFSPFANRLGVPLNECERLFKNIHPEYGVNDRGNEIEDIYRRYAGQFGVANETKALKTPPPDASITFDKQYIGISPGAVRQIKKAFNKKRITVFKADTGSGKTTFLIKYLRELAALESDKIQFITVPNTNTAKQLGDLEENQDLLAIYEGVTPADIREYYNKGGRVIIGTYDAIKKIKKTGLSIQTLVIDELHELLAAREYRKIIQLLDYSAAHNAEKVILCSATPGELIESGFKYLGWGFVSASPKEPVKRKLKLFRGVTNDNTRAGIYEALKGNPTGPVVCRINSKNKINALIEEIKEGKTDFACKAKALGVTPENVIKYYADSDSDSDSDSDDYKERKKKDCPIENENIKSGIRLLMVTNIIDSAINIKNENASGVFVMNANEPFANANVKQFFARFRRSTLPGVLVIRNRKQDYPLKSNALAVSFGIVRRLLEHYKEIQKSDTCSPEQQTYRTAKKLLFDDDIIEENGLAGEKKINTFGVCAFAQKRFDRSAGPDYMIEQLESAFEIEGGVPECEFDEYELPADLEGAELLRDSLQKYPGLAAQIGGYLTYVKGENVSYFRGSDWDGGVAYPDERITKALEDAKNKRDIKGRLGRIFWLLRWGVRPLDAVRLAYELSNNAWKQFSLRFVSLYRKSRGILPNETGVKGIGEQAVIALEAFHWTGDKTPEEIFEQWNEYRKDKPYLFERGNSSRELMSLVGAFYAWKNTGKTKQSRRILRAYNLADFEAEYGFRPFDSPPPATTFVIDEGVTKSTQLYKNVDNAGLSYAFPSDSDSPKDSDSPPESTFVIDEGVTKSTQLYKNVDNAGLSYAFPGGSDTRPAHFTRAEWEKYLAYLEAVPFPKQTILEPDETIKRLFDPVHTRA